MKFSLSIVLNIVYQCLKIDEKTVIDQNTHAAGHTVNIH